MSRPRNPGPASSVRKRSASRRRRDEGRGCVAARTARRRRSSASASAEAICVRIDRNTGWPFSFRMLSENATSFAPRRRAVMEACFRTQAKAVGQTCLRRLRRFLQRGHIRASGSSPDPVISVSNVAGIPAAPSPLQNEYVEGVERIEVLVAGAFAGSGSPASRLLARMD